MRADMFRDRYKPLHLHRMTLAGRELIAMMPSRMILLSSSRHSTYVLVVVYRD